MKILYVIESLASGGKERRLISLIKELLKIESNEIEIVLLSNMIHYKEIYDFDIKIHFLKRNILKDIRLIFKFNMFLVRFQPDLVHCWDNIAAIHFAPLCKAKKIPFINSMISTAPPILSRFSKRYLLNAISYPFSTIILTNSKAGLHSFRVPSKKRYYIYNGFDLNRTNVKRSKKSIKNKLSIGLEKIIGMTASFSDKKDYETFVCAGKNILKKRKDVIFLAIGDGPNFAKVKNSVEDEYLSNFRFLGKQDDVESIVNIFDVGVLATFTEGISNAIMEYMIFGKPVIATNGGGTKELVVNKENGFLIGEQNVDQLSEKIEYLLDNPDIAKTMGENGKKRIEQYFSMDAMVTKTLELYRVVLNKGLN